jgi:hypothetical protein
MMEEVLVWVMGDAAGTRMLVGSFGTNGVIYRCDWVGVEIDRGSYLTKTPVSAASDLIGITQRAEDRYDMILEPTVLRVPPPPYGRNPNLNDWVEAEVWTVVETRMKMQRVAEIRRKQAAGRLS